MTVMDTPVLFIIPLTVAVVFLFLGYHYFLGRQPRPEEQGLVPLFQEQGGGRFDGFNLTLPLVRFAVYRDFLLVAHGRATHRLPRTGIERIEPKKFLLSTGIIIHHRVNNVPKQLIFWSRSPGRVLDILRQQGFPVMDRT